MLCKKCSQYMYIMNIGMCHNCPSHTSSGAFTLCSACSKAKDECMHCRKSLSKQPDADDDEQSDQ